MLAKGFMAEGDRASRHLFEVIWKIEQTAVGLMGINRRNSVNC